MFEIREIKPGEDEFLREALYEAVYLPENKPRPPKSVLDEPLFANYYKNFGRRGDFAFVLVDDGELIGAVWTRLFDKENASYGFLDEETPELSIAAFEKYRGQGFGRQLLEKLFEKLKREGFAQVSLSVDKRNRAVNLYRKIGFELIAEEGNALTMAKTLI